MPFAVRPGPAPAVTALVRYGVDFTVHPYDPDEIDDGVDLAQLLDVDPDRVLDTVIVDAGGRLVACILPAGLPLDEDAASSALGEVRVRPALDPLAERATGHRVEATSPFGHRRRLTTLIDEAVVALGGASPGITVFVASGQPGLAVEVALADLVRLTAAVRAPLTTV